MKQILTILFAILSCASYAQFPVTHGQSNSHTKEKFEGAVYPVKGLINGRYVDTATANLDYVAGEAGAQIVVGNTIYLRDSTATKWIVAGGYGVIASNITILNDSSISICNGITPCDTFYFTNIVVNNFSVVNDSTILVCDGNNVCDTLFIPPTPISKNFVDSTKIIDGVIYYYINGNAYSGGAVTGTSQYQWSVLDSLNNVISPQQGDVYLVSTSPSGSFVGHENQIAQYDTTAGFTFTSPNVGDLLYNSTTYQVSKWTGTAWVLQPPPLVENWWSRVAWNGAPGQYIQTGAKNSYLTMFGSLNGTNTGLGRQVFTDNPTGGDGGNTAIGSTSQFHIRAGAYNNTSVGNYSLWYHVSGHDQVAIGYNAASTGDKIFSIGLGTNAPNNNNTFSISDSTNHLYMRLDSASGVAPSVIGKDANGNWHTYQTPSGGSGSGNTKYLLQGYGTKIDSAGANYTVAVDSAAFKDSLYVGRGIKADTTAYPNHVLLTVDSNYVRDTSLHLAGGTINQVLKKNSSTNGDWGWQDESGGGSTDTTSLSNRIDAKQDALTLTTKGTSGAATLIGDTLNIPQYSASDTTSVSLTKSKDSVLVNNVFAYRDSLPYTDFDYINESFTGSSLPATWTAVGSPSYTVSGKISFTGTGSSTYTQYVRSNLGVLTEQNSIEATYVMDQSPSSSTGGIAVGFQSYNPHGYVESLMFGFVTKSTDANYGKSFIYSPYSSYSSYSTNANTNINNGDVINIKATRTGLVWSVVATNITQGWAVRKDFVSTTPTTPFVPNNSAYPAIYHLGGSVSVLNFKYTIHEPLNKDIMIVGNSIMLGQGASSPYKRSVANIGTPKNNIYSSGGADASAEIVARLPEIIAIHPRRVLLHDVPGNDIFFSVATATWQQNLQTIDSTLKANNIEAIWTNGQPRTATNESAQKSFFDTAFKRDLIIDTWTPLLGSGTALNPVYNSDGTHPNDAGHYATANAINASIAYIPNNLTDTLKRSNDSIYLRKNGLWVFQYKDSVGAGGGGGSGWALTLNSGTNSVTNGVGTSDKQGFSIKTNSIQRIAIDSSGADSATYSADLITNGTFASGTGWTTGTGWTIGSGVATKSAGSASNLTQDLGEVSGYVYRIKFDYTRSAGTLSIAIGGVTDVATYSAASGSVDVNITSTGTGDLSFIANSAFAGTIDNVVVTRIEPTSSWVSFYNGRGIHSLSLRASLSNEFIGISAGKNNISGLNNSAIGFESFYSNITGNDNLAFGFQSLKNNTIGRSNSAIGSLSLTSNTVGFDNVANGYKALMSNLSGSENVATGFQSLLANTTGTDNNAYGSNTLAANTSGIHNVAIGSFTLAANTTAGQNTAIGFNTMISNQTGGDNAAFGWEALRSNLSGMRNTAVGAQSLYNTTGSFNVGVGYAAAIGQSSGSYNQVYGAWVAPVSNTGSGQLNIGNVIYGTNLYQTAGASAIPTPAGSIGIGVPPLARFNIVGGTNVANTQPLKIDYISLVTTGASGTGIVSTITFATQTYAPFPVGSKINISGVTPSGYNGTFTVSACTTSSVSFNSTATGTQTVAGVVEQSSLLDVLANGSVERDSTSFYLTTGSGANIQRNKIIKGVAGTATLSSGTVIVSSTYVKSNSRIIVSVDTPSGTQGFLSTPIGSVISGVSFVINSTSASENSTVNWLIINP